ncbi:MAG: EAL domain-containing protein [Methyloversatilis sp.]|uniref:EAL domain-containing protein n=1 Tax=Methyloversatilis sp. TaxID=2569862 RepID=UPI002735444A|nr:EAL domain-containing protein [Methyloversatilis sp.]MDP3872026.1 EAL domain-containing protein [Methyloversatilis sp.]
MSIQRLFYVIAGLCALISAGAGYWQLTDSRAKLRAAEWTLHANRLSDVAQKTSASLAMERGITAAMLARPADASPSMQQEMRRIRADVGSLYAQLDTITELLSTRAPDHQLFFKLKELRELRSQMEIFRARVDEQLRGSANELDPERWIDLMTRCIADLQNLAAISMQPRHDNRYTLLASGPVIKDLLFTLNDYVGRERAVIGVAIARNLPLSEKERRILDESHIIAVRTRERIEAILAHQPADPALMQARLTFAADYLGRHEDLRAQIYASSLAREPYSVDAERWYREATVGINAILGLSSTLSSQLEVDIARLRAHAARTMDLLVVIFCALAILFAISAQIFRRRILRPLNALEQAAKAISQGDLRQAPVPQGGDELGHLGKTFEFMRQSLLEDIARREQDDSALRKLNALIEQSTSAMFVTDANGIIEYANTQFSAITGYPKNEALGRKAGFWRSNLTPTGLYRQMWEAVQEGKVWEGEMINRRKNGELYWASMTVSPVSDKAGVITHFISIQSDISERRRIEQRLNYLSNYDELTELPNRALLAQHFVHASAEARLHASMIGFVSIGISRFKRINDSLGQDVGDQLLRVVAQRLGDCARSGDMVSRHSGTEFTLMATKLGQPDEMIDLLARINGIVNRPVIIKGEKLQLTINAGASLMPRDGDTLDELLRKATTALHHAERNGLSHCLYTDALDQDAQERISLENALRTSLECDGLELHYQPKVDLATGCMVGVEALARWCHPLTHEYVSPSRFIPIAEESGLISHLGAWALRQACRQNKAWLDAGLPRITVAVNLSAAQLHQPCLVDTVAEILKETGLDPSQLELELTESALMEDPEQANDVLSRLNALGLRLSIDDFGTGYSSLAYLSRFPVDQLKIDRSFVQGITTDVAAEAISTSVIALAHQMGLRVIAEGVETEAQLMFLNRHGCDEIQGYYYSPPIPALDLAVLLTSHKQLELPGRNAPQRTLLVVDDEPAMLAMIAQTLDGEDYRVLSARSGRQALELLACNEVQVILTDERMPEMGGMEFLRLVNTRYPETVRIVLSGYADTKSIMEIVNTGAIYKYFTKPWNEARLRADILDAFRHQATQAASSHNADALAEPVR